MYVYLLCINVEYEYDIQMKKKNKILKKKTLCVYVSLYICFFLKKKMVKLWKNDN
jgi:hypothetical protein